MLNQVSLLEGGGIRGGILNEWKSHLICISWFRFHEIPIFQRIGAPCIIQHQFQVARKKKKKNVAWESDKGSLHQINIKSTKSAKFLHHSRLDFDSTRSGESCTSGAEIWNWPKSRKNDQRRQSVTIRAECRKCEVATLRASTGDHSLFILTSTNVRLVFSSAVYTIRHF